MWETKLLLKSTSSKAQRLRFFKACSGVWDNITCWRPANVGETVTVPCPKVFSNFYSKAGNISKNCTSDGWSETFPDFVDACGYSDPEDESKITFYILVKAIYTLGYSVSLMSLATGSIILCLFRKLHCTRNYIHLNLFLSFILRAISVLVKDDVLYSSSGGLQAEPGLPAVLHHGQLLLAAGGGAVPPHPPGGGAPPRKVLPGLPPDRMGPPHRMHRCVDCSQALLRRHRVSPCPDRNLENGPGNVWQHEVLWKPGGYLVGRTGSVCGQPTATQEASGRFMGRNPMRLEYWRKPHAGDRNCWDTNDHSVPWWVIRIPILISIIVNFVLFISIIRILLQKLTSPDVGGNDQSQYKRLAKSTLLLIPLFGVHYMVFAVFPISISSKYQILFELCLGSFQGLVVAVLYCFLNSEVQCELKRKWRSRCPTPSTSRDYRACGSSISRNGSEGALQFHRGSRAPSFLQTETSVL
ncbi:vasoactive intestinal polypeptide receptor 2 isoform X3 [Rhinopithecus roxellana]|uniref:vasoactive intestinal polypeptide receptor 2 isoform X3 n=1 Tax=Rhinopithecus roxellana TaxID=61622 RepID=UPI0012370B08|nr:vasoactive intestinal polypeptide receptor 2 isoform X3 [Rhinopithecus roxellana]